MDKPRELDLKLIYDITHILSDEIGNHDLENAIYEFTNKDKDLTDCMKITYLTMIATKVYNDIAKNYESMDVPYEKIKEATEKYFEKFDEYSKELTETSTDDINVTIEDARNHYEDSFVEEHWINIKTLVRLINAYKISKFINQYAEKHNTTVHNMLFSFIEYMIRVTIEELESKNYPHSAEDALKIILCTKDYLKDIAKEILKC